MSSESSLDRLPYLGSGLAYLPELRDVVRAHAAEIDWLEINTDDWLLTGAPRSEELAQLRRLFPLIPHGVELSIASPEWPAPGYLDAVAALVDSIQAPWFSDHLAFTHSGGVRLNILAPIPRSREMARLVGDRARIVQEAVGRPFLLENIVYLFDVDLGMSELDFLLEVLDRSGCGMVLDLANLDINRRNHGYDPIDFLDSLPADRIVQLHLAGGSYDGELARDTHGSPVPTEVWDLLDHLVTRAQPRASLLERNSEFPADFSEIASDLRRAREVLGAAARV